MDRSAIDARRVWTPIATGAFVLVLATLIYRTFGSSLRSTEMGGWLFHDFSDTVYYPARAMLDGRNPYDASAYLRDYPADKPFPPFAPFSLALYAPIALLSALLGAKIWFGLTVLLTLVLARVVLRAAGCSSGFAAALGLSAAILASRPGHWNLLLGQQTLVVVLGAYAALLGARSRPWLAATGLALSTLKPQFGAPLAVLLAAAGHFRVATLGVVMSGIGSLAVLAILPPSADAGSIGTFVEAFRGSASRIGDAATTWYSQVDAPYLLHHILGDSIGGADAAVAVLLLAVGAAAVRRVSRRGRPGDDEIAIAITCLTVLLSVYHQIYDVLLLTLPILFLVVGRQAPPWDRYPRLRLVLVALLAVPAVNYLATWNALTRLGITGVWWLLITSVNATVLSIALSLYIVTAFRRPCERTAA